MDQITEKTAHQDPAGSRWAVLRSERFWRGAAGWSAVIFAFAVGAATLGIVYWTGDPSYEPPWFLVRKKKDRPVAEEPAAPPVAARGAVDGMPLAEGESDGAYIAALIDNQTDARPASGLARASLVIEAPVEGGITRLLAVFAARSEVKKIGPVRSVRPYHLDWVAEYDAVFAHVGGSPEALEKIKTADIRDLNQFFNGAYYWRSADRRAPHNVYTSAELLNQAGEKRFSSMDPARHPEPWLFKDEPALQGQATPADLVIEYSAPAYRVTWKYDAKDNAYVRFQGGKAQRDEDGTSVRAKNIVVQYTKVRVLDEVGRRHIATVGEGKALIAIDGRTVEGTWSKKAPGSRTRFFEKEGGEAVFNAGATWMQVVSDTTEVTY